MAWSAGLLGSMMVSLPLEWVAATGSGYGSVVNALDGDVYIQTYTTLYKLDKNGKFKWGRSVSSSGNWQTLEQDNNGNLYATSTGGLAISYDANGNVRWLKSLNFSTIEASGVDPSGNYFFVAGNDSSYGYIACLNGTTGAHVWGKGSPYIQWQGTIGVDPTGKINLVGYIQNGTKFDSTYVEMYASNGGIIFQKRIALTGDYSFGQGAKFNPINGNGTVGGYMGFYTNWIVQFNSVGTTQFSIKAAMTDSSYISTGYGTIGFDAGGNLYQNAIALYTNYGAQNWGSFVAKLSGSTYLGGLAIGGLSGFLRVSVDPIYKIIGFMTTGGFAKIQYDPSPPLGTYGSYTVRENPDNLTYTSSGLSISSDSVSYSSIGNASTPSNTVSSVGSQPAITYLG